MSLSLTSVLGYRHSFIITNAADDPSGALAELTEIVGEGSSPLLTLAMAQAVLADMRANYQVSLFGVNTGGIFEINGTNPIALVYTGT